MVYFFSTVRLLSLLKMQQRLFNKRIFLLLLFHFATFNKVCLANDVSNYVFFEKCKVKFKESFHPEICFKYTRFAQFPK